MSFDEDNEDILHWATIDRQDIVMLEVNMMTGLADETARYSGFNPVYAFPTEDHSSIYLVHQDKKTKKHELYCTRYQFNDEDEEIKSTESEDHEVHIYKEKVEPLDKLSETINMIKLIGNQLLIISTDDKTGSVLTIYDNMRNIYAMKSEAITKKGKKVQSMKFNEFFTYKDTSSTLSECFDCAILSNDKLYGLKSIADDSVDIVHISDDSRNLREKTVTITEVSNFRFHYPYMA